MFKVLVLSLALLLMAAPARAFTGYEPPGPENPVVMFLQWCGHAWRAANDAIASTTLLRAHRADGVALAQARTTLAQARPRAASRTNLICGHVIIKEDP